MPATAPFSTVTLVALERRLHDEHHRLTAMAAAAHLELRTAADGLDLSDLLDGDAPDSGSLDLDRHRAEAVIALATGQLEETTAALDRLRRGDYGWCRDCRGRIPLARLRALPAAARCAPCQVGVSWPLRVAG